MTISLLAWAADQFWLAQEVNGHGVSRAAVLQHIENITGTRPKGHGAAGHCPSSLQHIWEWFLILAESYGSVGDVLFPSPGQWREDLIAFTGIAPYPAELQILGKLLVLWRTTKTKST